MRNIKQQIRAARFLGLESFLQVLKLEIWDKVIFVKYTNNEGKNKTTFLSKALFLSNVQNGKIEKLAAKVYLIHINDRISQIWGQGQLDKVYLHFDEIWQYNQFIEYANRKWGMSNLRMQSYQSKGREGMLTGNWDGNFTKARNLEKGKKDARTLKGRQEQIGYETKIFRMPEELLTKLINKANEFWITGEEVINKQTGEVFLVSRTVQKICTFVPVIDTEGTGKIITLKKENVA